MLALLGLAGCGLSPIYGGTTMTLGQFAYETEDSVAAFRLRQRLIERLGETQTPRYVIKTTLDLTQRAAAITEDGDTSRLNVIGVANWSLLDARTGTQLETGTVEGFTSYSATGSTVATQTTRDDARARVGIILADMIVARVLLSLPDSNK